MRHGAVAHFVKELDGFLIERGGRARKPADVQRHVVVELAEDGLFHAVKALVAFLHRLHNRAGAVQIVVVVAVSGVDHIVIQRVHAPKPVEEAFDCNHRNHHHADDLLVLPRAVKPQHREPDRNQNQRKPDAGIIVGRKILVVGVGVFLENHAKQGKNSARSRNGFERYGVKLVHRAAGKHREDEAEHEAVAIIEPVGALEAVPEQVGDRKREGRNEQEDKERRRNLLPHGILAGEEIGGNQEQGQHTAINERIPRRAHGVIGGRQEFVEQVKDVEIEAPDPLCGGEGALSEAERIVSAEQDDRRNADGKQGPERHAQARAEKMATLVVGIVLAVLGMPEIAEEKVEKAVDANHVADIEVAEQGNRQRNGIKAEFALLDQRFHPKRNHRQPHHRVNPHGVVLLDNAVSRKRIAGGEHHDCGFVRLFGGLVHIKPERAAAECGFEQEQEEQTLQHPILREERQQIGKRAGKVVSIDAEEFAAERAGEGVEQVRIAVHEVSQSLKEPNVLPVEVEDQHAPVPERVKLAGEINQIHHNRRDQHTEQQIAPIAEATLSGLSFCGQDSLYGSVYGTVHGFSVPFCPAEPPEICCLIAFSSFRRSMTIS